jgi:hypothetical protein
MTNQTRENSRMRRHHARGGRGAGAALAAFALLGTLAACDSLLDVDPPSRIPAGELEDPANANLLVTSAVGDFECAFGAYTVLGGLIGEELGDATQTADRFPYDRRQVGPGDRRYSAFDCDALGVYLPINRARASADNVARRLETWTDAEVANRTALLGRSLAYAGYSLVLLGEGFCSATISNIELDGTLTYGTEMTPAQILAAAEERFTRAVAQPGISTADKNLALLGRARARLDQGRYAEARADAALIPAGFLVNVTGSGTSSRRQNRVWAQNATNNNSTTIGERYRGLADPRVPVYDKARASATGVALWGQSKYPDATSPIPLATYEEAQLIIAEADARAGGGALANAITLLNAIRARGGQGAMDPASTQAQVLAEVVEQRRRELFLESQHLGDVIRFGIALQPVSGTAYPGGGTYGNSKCLPLPDVERINNPNI